MGGVEETPGPGSDDPESVIAGDDYDGPRPRVVRSVPSPEDAADELSVLGTNLALAVLTLILLLLTATLFNQTLQENEVMVKDFFARYFGPIGHVIGRLDRGLEGLGGGLLSVILGPLVILGLTGLVYGFVEPGFGFNEKSAVLFISLIIGCGLITYMYSGGQAFLTRSRFGLPAGVKVFPVGLLVAVLCVFVTRVVGFEPGVIYGFIASFVVFGGMSLTRDQEGHSVFYPGLMLLSACVAAWLLLGPFRELSEDNDNWYAAIPEAAAVVLFVGGLEGLFFNMIPLKFMDGAKLWEWNKVAWAAMAGVATFLFWHVLLNKEQDSFGAIQETTPAVALFLLGICVVISFGFWAFFRLRAERAGLI